MPTILLAGCAILKDGKLLLIRKTDKDIWELPGGPVKQKGDDEQAAISKTQEQIGISPEVIQQFTLLEYQNNGNNIEAAIFESYIESDATFIPGEGIDEIKWFETESIDTEKIGDDVKAVLEEI
ncbi:MAG: NUDIX hydrolase [Candidatus Woesearchaeota archaeon]